MNPAATAFTALTAILLSSLPRRWAVVPLLMGACYVPLGPGLEIGGAHFYVFRLLLIVGVLRVLLRGERWNGRPIGLDVLVILWAIVLCASSCFHKAPSSDLVLKSGLALDAAGTYFLFRIFCSSTEDVLRLFRAWTLILLPLAAAMIYENVVRVNVFGHFLGGVSESPAMRAGKVRARGPFQASMLAGTLGAVAIPAACALRRRSTGASALGLVGCLSIILSCNSSGPVISAAAAVSALLLWQYRRQSQLFPWIGLAVYIALDIVMKDPAYYIIGRLDVTGSSDGYHRCAVIDAARSHVDEWWLAGTDYTRHWLSTGVSWSPDHTDITNQYIKMGVLGGLPLMLLFIACLARAFHYVRIGTARPGLRTSHQAYVMWALGSALFCHAATFMSVSYFDQIAVFYWMIMAAIGSLSVATVGSDDTSGCGKPIGSETDGAEGLFGDRYPDDAYTVGGVRLEGMTNPL